MELFKGQSLLEFTERFKTDLDCEEYLASLKQEDGIFTASKTHNSKEYTTTQIRRNRRKKQMKKQKMKLLLISLFLIGTASSCENVVNNNTEKDRLNESLSIESDTISDTICDTISNAQEHCDFEDFIKEEMGYLNGGFGSKGRLDLANINISVLIYKDGAKVFKINYSYLTNNLTIYKRVDEDDYEYDYIYKGQATPYLYRFLNKL